MSLPPLANVFAAFHHDPRVAEELADRIRAAHEEAVVRTPLPGWVVACWSLPGRAVQFESVSNGATILVFEGRDRLSDPGTGHPDSIDRFATSRPEVLARLSGDFGCLVLDPRRALLVRSCGGQVPVYVHESPDGVQIATRLTDLVRWQYGPVELDPLVVAMWISDSPVFPDDRTFFRGTTILPSGHFLERSAAGRTRVGKYWSPRPDSLVPYSRRRAKERSEQLRGLLLEGLRRGLDSERTSLLALSGGVDSSSLAVLACCQLDRSLSTLTYMPPRDDWQTRERRRIDALDRRCKFEQRHEFVVTEDAARDLAANRPAVAFMVTHLVISFVLALRRETPYRVYVAGEFSDEAFGHRHAVPYWALHTPLARLLLFPWQVPFGSRGAKQWLVHRARSAVATPHLMFPAGLRELVHPELHAEYADWRLAQQKRVAADRRPRTDLAILLQYPCVPMHWEGLSGAGVRLCFPFFSRETIELAFQCHPRELIGPGTKIILRQALARDVPREHLSRQDKGHWGVDPFSGSVSLTEPFPEELERVLEPGFYSNPPKSLSLRLALHLSSVANILAFLRIRGH